MSVLLNLKAQLQYELNRFYRRIAIVSFFLFWVANSKIDSSFRSPIFVVI